MHTPPKLIRLFALYENLTRFAQPLCTQLTDREHPRTPITLSTNIVDVGGVSLKQFWNLKGHMQAASQLATAHYPETLDRIFVSLLLLVVPSLVFPPLPLYPVDPPIFCPPQSLPALKIDIH